MLSLRNALAVAALLSALGQVPRAVHAQLTPDRNWYGVNRSIPVLVQTPEQTRAIPEIHLLDPATGETIEIAPVEAGHIDLAASFPILWTSRQPRLLLAQLVVERNRVAAPLVLVPIIDGQRAVHTLGARALDAVENADKEEFQRLMSLPREDKETLRQRITLRPPETDVYAGLRVFTLRDVEFITTAGSMRFALRPDKAPNTTCFFMNLVQEGYYTEIPFHRIVPRDGRGHPFIAQAGDPTSTGYGGCGISIDFESSDLPHDYGVLSIARRPDDPNSNGAQFFICLGREACRNLDGLYVSFAQLVEGSETLATIASVPVGPRDPNAPAAAQDRPFEAPVILEARLIDAPPYAMGPRPPAKPTEHQIER